MWPDLFAWTMGALLIVFLPATRDQAGLAIASGWLLAAMGSSILALMQYFDLENGLYPWVAPTIPGYVTANVHQLNMLASLLAVGLLCVWCLVIKRRLATVHAVWMVGLLLVALAATASRTGIVHLVAISCMLLYWHARQWRRVLLVLVLGWAVYTLAANSLPWLAWVTRGIVIDRNLLGRFGENVGCHSRRLLWANMVDLIAMKPWTGWGPGELLYAHYITDFGDQRFCEKLSNAHNLPLQFAVTLGIPVAAVFGLLFAWALFKLKPWAATHPMERLCWGVLVLLGVHSLLEYPLWFGVFQLMALLAAWQIYQVWHQGAGAAGAEAGPSVRGRVMVSGLLLAMLSFVAWDYVKVSQLYLPDHMRMERYREDTFNKARDTVLFKSHVLIAQIVAMELKPENAELILQGSLASLHVAPDSRVIRRVIESAALLGRSDLVELHVARYKAAWPKQYAEWIELQKAAAANR
ncbi:PglL family O-oligosaccharyltransferase [Hydrogenophaga sp. IBVHS1]|uniref:PglL family O-oligosaccharyltransferase n=1 Tax=Hydrogenophaga sp. IBVHS1 TaxID=1985169 RepID=UPI0015C5122A|nr:O-antigen ligase family protein [Hydrogenophaga sp. IBVHS1]